jgi:hypothetical protein
MSEGNSVDQRRAEAQAAMESEAHRAARAKKEQELEHQRHAAKLAMEDERHRHIREAKEKEERDRQTILQRAQAEAKRQAEVKRLQAEAALAEKERQAAAATQAKNAKSDQISSAEKLIDQLKQAGSTILSPLRTFKTDMAKAVGEKGLSAAKIAIAEQERLRNRSIGSPAVVEEAPKRSHWGLIFLLLLILIAGGVGAGSYWLHWNLLSFVPSSLRAYVPFSSNTTPVVSTPKVPVGTPFFSTETSLALNADDKAALASISKPTGLAGSFTHLYLYRGSQVLGLTAARQALAATWPDAVTRVLNDQFMLGNFNLATNSDHRFIMLKPKFYEQAFNSLLNWERSMPDDLASMLGPSSPRNERAAEFSDRIFRNKDVRLLKNTAGQTILLYSFLDPDTIVITKDEETFAEIFKRFVAGN